MSFLNPIFLLGLLAAAVPVLIHLLTRRRPRERPFSSLAFLAEVNQSEVRRLRLKQWLLLLLRTLAVAALALALARPALRGTAARGGGAAASTVVALVDVSGSMGAFGLAAGEAAPPTLARQARRVVEDLLAALGPADELLLVPYDRAPRPLGERPLGDVPRLRAATQALEAGSATTDHAAALALAARALAASRSLNRELFWISDFQASGFPPGAPAAPPGPWDRARVFLVPLAPRTRANVALTDAALTPSAGGPALTVSALAFDAAPGDLAVAVTETRGGDGGPEGRGGSGELARGFLALPARGAASTLLPLARLPEEGGAAFVPADVLPLDDRRFFAAGRGGTLRVVLRADGPPAPLRLALEAGAPASGLAVEAADAAALPARLPGADVLVIDDVERLGATETQAVLDFVRGGGGVLVVLGPRADADFWNRTLLDEAGLGALGADETAAPGAGAAAAAWRLVRVTAGHPALAGLPERPGEAVSTARFTRIRRFAPAGGARVLLEFDRAHPALLEGARVMAFAAGLDPAGSDFPVSGAFLPLLHQAVKVLGRGTAAASLPPGERFGMPAGTGPWRIEDAEGGAVSAELVAAGGATRLVSAPLERPGLYRVRQGPAVRATFAVNPDPRESDLAAVPEAALVRAFPAGRARILAPGADLARRVREARYGRELWGWFVALALALLAAESVVGRRGMAGRRDPGGDGAA